MAGPPQAVQCKIEQPDDHEGDPIGTRLVDKAYVFSTVDQIGEGTYGKVFQGTDSKGKRVALKMIRMDSEKEGFPITALREIKILSGLNHVNIVNLREIVRSKGGLVGAAAASTGVPFVHASHAATRMVLDAHAPPLPTP